MHNTIFMNGDQNNCPNSRLLFRQVMETVEFVVKPEVVSSESDAAKHLHSVIKRVVSERDAFYNVSWRCSSACHCVECRSFSVDA